MRAVCAFCKTYCRPSPGALTSAVVARGVRFFTSGRGALRRERSVDSTGTWWTDMSFLRVACGVLYYKRENCSPNTPTSGVEEIDENVHLATLTKKHSKHEIRQRLGCERAETGDDAFDVLVEERGKLEYKGEHG